MILKAYSLLDSRVGVYSQPFFAQHDAYALRIVERLLRETENTVAQYPEDFHLYRVGEFDDACGMLTHSVFEVVCPMSALLVLRPGQSA